ncbi:AraC family transcriptional regulator [Paenibacillus contaminans]|nr:AraC family transcriptional regulator [Paenibacillus contaminans]
MTVAFNEYLLMVRMERAKILPAGKDKKVYEIALEVGYSDLNGF